jgi:capsular polysaccharide biosynthesis protein
MPKASGSKVVFWLVGLIVVCVIFTVCGMFYTRKPAFMGRATVLERNLPQASRYWGARKSHLADLAAIATSQKVMQRASNMLRIYGVSVDPDALLRTVKVEPIQGTEILKVEAVSSNPEDAKAAADVVASEFKQVYTDMIWEAAAKGGEPAKGKHSSAIGLIDEAYVFPLDNRSLKNAVATSLAMAFMGLVFLAGLLVGRRLARQM